MLTILDCLIAYFESIEKHELVIITLWLIIAEDCPSLSL